MVFIFTSIELINKENKLSINIDSFIKDTGILLTYFEDGGLKGEFSKIKGMNQHGQSINSTSFSERLINLEGIILADNRKQIEAFRNLLVRILNPLQDVILKYNENSTTKEIVVRAEETPAFSTDYKTNNENGLAFKCDLNGYNPFWQDLKEYETTLVTWIPNLEFPAQENAGMEFFHTEQTPNYWLETSEININKKNYIQLSNLHDCNFNNYNLTTKNNFTIKDKNEVVILSEDDIWSGVRTHYIPVNNKEMVLSFNNLSKENTIILYAFCFDSNRFLIKQQCIKDFAVHQTSYCNYKKIVADEKSIVNFDFINSDIDSIILCFGFVAGTNYQTSKSISKVKLEEGNIATDWESAIEDILFQEFVTEFGEGIGQEWGYRELKQIVEVDNVGDVECPLRVVFRANGDVEKPYIQNVETYELIRINRTLKSGDILEITTGYGNKNVYLNGKKAHQYLDFLNSSWLQLKPGINLIKYGAEKGLNNLDCTVFYTPLYLGV